MNFVYQIIPYELANAIGLTIFHSLWQGLVISVVLGIAILFLDRKHARIRYKLSVIALAFFVLCVIATFSKVYQRVNTDEAIINPNSILENTHNFFPVELINITDSSNGFPNLFENFEIFFIQNLSLIVTIWLLGLLIFSLRFIGGVIYVQKLRTTGTLELPDWWNARIKFLIAKAKVNRIINVMESTFANVPIAIGYIKPVILLPLGMISGIPQNQVEAIIAHEIAHIRRNDFLINLLQSIAETIFFYHPAIWWLSSVIRSERENCCDDIAVELSGDAITYSNALINIQELRGSKSTLALAASGNGNQLYRRIKRMNEKNKNRLSYGIKFAAFASVILLLAVVSLYSGNSFATMKAKTNYASFFNNPFELKIESESNNEIDLNTAATPDTTGLRNGKRTLRFTEKENGVKVRYKARLEDGKLVSLSIDGEKIPDNELSKYESKISKNIDKYDDAIKELNKNKEEYKKIAKEYSAKTKELREKLKDLHKDNFDFDFDFEESFDFDFPKHDLSELRESMKELKHALRDEFANRHITIPPIHIPKIEIPPIHIPPVPPVPFNDEEWDKWNDQFKENMSEFKAKMKEHKWDMEEFNENMKDFRKKMKVFGVEMKKFGTFIKEMKNELVEDGIIEFDDDLDELLLSEDKMEVNGKSVSADMHKKYKDLYEKHTGKKIEGKNKIRIND